MRARVRALYQRLAPLENAIYKKVEEMEKKLFVNLKRREATLYDSIEKTRNESSRASANYTSAQLRVAEKYGYQRPPRRRRCRWLNVSQEEEVEE